MFYGWPNASYIHEQSKKPDSSRRHSSERTVELIPETATKSERKITKGEERKNVSCSCRSELVSTLSLLLSSVLSFVTATVVCTIFCHRYCRLYYLGEYLRLGALVSYNRAKVLKACNVSSSCPFTLNSVVMSLELAIYLQPVCCHRSL